MIINIKQGAVFAVDVTVRQEPGLALVDLTGCTVRWLFDSHVLDAVIQDPTLGVVRFTATPEQTITWSKGTHNTTLEVYFSSTLVTKVKPKVQVYEFEPVTPIPDPLVHQGPLGTLSNKLKEFTFEGAIVATGGTGADGADGVDGDTGWSPILAVVSDSERRVLQVVDWTGGTGTPPATGDYIGVAGLEALIANGVDIRGDVGLPGGTSNTFSTVNANGTNLVADTTADTLNLAVTAGLSLSGNAGTDTATFGNSDRGSVAVTAHEAAGDPHPQYTTLAEAIAAAPVQSVTASGGGITASPTTGAVIITNTGVRTLTGTAGQIGVSSPTGTPVLTNLGVLTVNGSPGAVSVPAFGFQTFRVNGIVDIVADAVSDIFNMNSGAGITLTPVAGTDTLTFANSGVLSVNGNVGAVTVPAFGFQTFRINGATDCVADAVSDVFNLNSSTGISLTPVAGTDSVTINNTGVLNVNGLTGSVTTVTSSSVVLNTSISTTVSSYVDITGLTITVLSEQTADIRLIVPFSLGDSGGKIKIALYHTGSSLLRGSYTAQLWNNSGTPNVNGGVSDSTGFAYGVIQTSGGTSGYCIINMILENYGAGTITVQAKYGSTVAGIPVTVLAGAGIWVTKSKP